MKYLRQESVIAIQWKLNNVQELLNEVSVRGISKGTHEGKACINVDSVHRSVHLLHSDWLVISADGKFSRYTDIGFHAVCSLEKDFNKEK